MSEGCCQGRVQAWLASHLCRQHWQSPGFICGLSLLMGTLRTVPCPEFGFQDAVMTNGKMVLGIDRKQSHRLAEGQVVAMMTLREGQCASRWEEAGARRGAPGLCCCEGAGYAGFHSCVFRSVCCRIRSERQRLPDRDSQPFPRLWLQTLLLG